MIFKYVLRDKQTNGLSQLFNYLIVPVLGFITVVVMWFGVDQRSMYLGLGWAFLGALWLGIKTKGFSQLPPQYQEDDV